MCSASMLTISTSLYQPIKTRTAEIDNIESCYWLLALAQALANNLTLNLSKTVEIVFMDSIRKREREV